jgi:Domain of unknown function (DUF4868)
MPDNFFAILTDHTVKKITLAPDIEPEIQDIFVGKGTALTEDKDQIEFDGNYKIEEDEVLYVTMDLPAELGEIAGNAIGIHRLDLTTDRIKALVWYEDDTYYFQNFDSRKLLHQKKVIYFDNQTFNQLTQDAFVIDSIVHAVYTDGTFYFQSYANANKIFSLKDFYQAATDEELNEFSEHESVAIEDQEWFLAKSNSVVRKQVALLQRSSLLDDVDPKKIKRGAKKFKIPYELDEDGRIIFPRDMKKCKALLLFLNEQCYEGPITKRQYATNSKRRINEDGEAE